MGRKLGCCAPFRGPRSPSYTMSPRPEPTSIPSGILIHPFRQQTWAENWGLCSLGGAGYPLPYNTMPPGPRSICLLSAILTHPAVWPHQTWAENWGGGCDPFEGAGSYTMWPGSRSTSLPSGTLIHPAVWLQQTWAENGGLCPSLGSWAPLGELCPFGGWVPI